MGNSAWPMENLGRALPLPPAPGRFAPAARVCPPAQCAWRLGPGVRPEAGSSRAQAAAASSSVREQRRGGTGRRGSSPAPPAQPGSARLPPHAGAAAAVARREGGGRNPAPSTRSPSWTIMTPSKPTTTCSPKRTGIAICYWTRPGRSSRERSAAVPARRSPPPRPAPPAALAAQGSERVPGAPERGRGCAAAARWGVGLQTWGGRWSALPQSPRTPSPSGAVGPPAGRSPWGRRSRPPGCRRIFLWAGRGGGAPEAGAEPLARRLLLGIDFPFASPPPCRLSIWRAVAASFLGRPGLGTWKGPAARDLAPPSPYTEEKRAPEGLAAASGSAWRWTC